MRGSGRDWGGNGGQWGGNGGTGGVMGGTGGIMGGSGRDWRGNGGTGGDWGGNGGQWGGNGGTRGTMGGNGRQWEGLGDNGGRWGGLGGHWGCNEGGFGGLEAMRGPGGSTELPAVLRATGGRYHRSAGSQWERGAHGHAPSAAAGFIPRDQRTSGPSASHAHSAPATPPPEQATPTPIRAGSH